MTAKKSWFGFGEKAKLREDLERQKKIVKMDIDEIGRLQRKIIRHEEDIDSMQDFLVFAAQNVPDWEGYVLRYMELEDKNES